ncbi:MAG: hypothetical protein HY820_10950 [Acidobacteria bacterium]|nr:hypothetical protein [Acidobacteriota bacterium]
MDITREHPEYKTTKAMLQKYSDLYSGGEALKARSHEYLERRQKEPLDVYMERLARVFYENYIGSIVDWYAATLFKREPVLAFDGVSKRGKEFFAAFTDDCDFGGTPLAAMLRRQFVSALVHGRSYLLVDFPRAAVKPLTRAEEDALGLSRAYLSGYTAQDLINWSRDDRGKFEWVVLRQVNAHRREFESNEERTEIRWLYFDRERYRVYRSTEINGKRTEPELADEGEHGFHTEKIVPLFELEISEGLWLVNKSALLQLVHFNKSNALAYALSMGLFAMPVVYTDKPWKDIIGESYYLNLGPGDRFGWTEPEGKVFQIAADNLTRLQEEIYRVCYLIHQAMGSNSNGYGQSGLSKQRDFGITQEVLRGYGDTIKDFTKRILRAIEKARQDELTIDVSGMDDFDIGDFSSDLADAERLLSLGIESPTLKVQVFKKLTGKYLCDVRQEVKDRISSEIDDSLLKTLS